MLQQLIWPVSEPALLPKKSLEKMETSSFTNAHILEPMKTWNRKCKSVSFRVGVEQYCQFKQFFKVKRNDQKQESIVKKKNILFMGSFLF